MLVFVVMTSAFLAESCQGDAKLRKQAFLKTANNTFEVHLVWRDVYVPIDTAERCELLCCSVRMRKSEGPTPRCTSITTVNVAPWTKSVCSFIGRYGSMT
jgi:hypothetical protein